MLIDAHCHLDSFQDPVAAIDRAVAAGVEHLIVNGLWNEDRGFGEAIALAETCPDRVSATAGIHPHDVAQAPEAMFDVLRQLAAHPRVVAVGETGLDYHYDHSPRGVQRERLRWSVALARAVQKPIVVHLREADDDALRILEEERAGEIGGQIHCFSGGPREAARFLDMGFHLSFSGVVTYKNAAALRDAAKVAPLDRMLVETDSPYLAPIPHRGKTNEPAYVVETARFLADWLGLPLERFAERTTANARALFRI